MSCFVSMKGLLLNLKNSNNTVINSYLNKSVNKVQSLLFRTFVKAVDQHVNTGNSLPRAYLQPEDAIFEMFKDETTNLLSIRNFLADLQSIGLRKTDPRLKEMRENLKEMLKRSNVDSALLDTHKVNLEDFRSIVSPNIGLISRALKNQFIIPEFQDFTKGVEEIYIKCKTNTNGKLASYIPQLAKMNPDYWGISICTIDGQRFSVGDVNVPFTIQSCSKPLTYALALDYLGEEIVHQYVGQEPSGRNFNELVLDYNKKPHNPMINAGAILVCAILQTLVKPEITLAERFDFAMLEFKRLAGGEDMGFNNAVYLSERESGDRNYALGFYMKEHKCFPNSSKFKECMDFYFQCCSMETNCDAVAVIGATLANDGICPLTEEKVLKSESVCNVLSLMHSCGMYDYSGQFAFKVGLPAKSGVCGCLLIVIPNVMGICTWSPPLDPLGNSCRGLQFCNELVKKFKFHRFDNLQHTSDKIDPRKQKFESTGVDIVKLLFCASRGDISSLRRHMLSGLDMALADYDSRTALHVAASEGHLHCVEYLIKHCKVPHDKRDRWGRTPKEEAASFGHEPVVQFFHQCEKQAELPENPILPQSEDEPSKK